MDEHPVIATLLQRMDDHPGFAGVATTLLARDVLNDEDETGSRDLTAAILRDAALTGRVLRLANASSRAARNVSTIDQAIVILGMNAVRSAASALDRIESIPHAPQARQMQAEIVAAHFCGELAAQIAHNSTARFNAQEARICGLLQNLGRMMATYYLFDEIEHGRALKAEQNLSGDEAAIKTLGVDFDDIGIAIAQHWNLPDVLQHSLMPRIDKLPPRSALNAAARNRFCSIFARRITDALFRVPQSRTKNDIAQEISFFRNVLSLRNDEVQEWIARALKATGDFLDNAAFGCDIAQAQGLLRKSSERVLDRLSPQDSLTRERAKNAGKKPIEVIYQILRLMHDAFHFDLTMLCLPSGSSDLVAIAGVGRNAARVTARFRCHGSKPDLFRSAAARRVDMYVGDTHAPVYEKLLPEWYGELVDARSFLILPLVHDDQLLGILYGDYSTLHPTAPQQLTLDRVQAWRGQLMNVLQADTPVKEF